MTKYIWVGQRESEVYGSNDFFEVTLTAWGSNKNNNISYSAYVGTRTIDIAKRNVFFVENLKKLLEQEDYQIMFYNSALAYILMQSFPDLAKHICCVNAKQQLDMLNNKIHTRLWLTNHLPVIPFTLLSGAECQFVKLQEYFPGKNQFIIQEARSAGGLGTFLMQENNYQYVQARLDKSTLYMISTYIYPSISLNVHVLVTNSDVVTFPASVQIIEVHDDNLLYSGADYVSYTQIDIEYQKKVIAAAKTIGDLLQSSGYLGLCGIDFLLYENSVYFVEINPRFQASTLILNQALHENDLPSIHQLQLMSFEANMGVAKELIENIKINYSLYKYSYEKYDQQQQYNNKMQLLEECKEVHRVLSDGFQGDASEKRDYLYSVLWKGHITSCSLDNKLHLHPNIPFDLNTVSLSSDNDRQELIHLKIKLLNQGIRILDSARNELMMSGGYNESVFNSIDLILFGYLRFNAPVNIRLTSISPFALTYKNNGYELHYYDTTICSVNLEVSKSFKNLKTKNGISYNKIAFISGDRLRIKSEQRCFYKMTGKGCAFCPGIVPSAQLLEGYSLTDIKEVVDYCTNSEKYRHILIGGGSANPQEDNTKLLSTISYIHSKTDKPLYLMALPPDTTEELDNYITAGISEVAFNIELYDRTLAQKYMPGKGMYPLKHYIKLLNYAAEKLGKGNARSMLMVGIESIDNTLTCVELLCRNNIQPMLSVFRPATNCSIPHLIQPSNTDLLYLYEAATKICDKYGLSLGPSCPSCQNNTLALTTKY